MTHASQLSPQSSDYFSHKPRSFLSLHTDFDEKLSAAHPPSRNADYSRGRRPSRLMAYEQPTLAVVPPSPRVPRSRTLVRLLLLLTILGLVSVGWRCEAVGCKGRGGGALVGDYAGASGYVGGGSVVAGWGSREGMDLSAIWERPSWGGERQGGEQEEGSSTLDAFKDEEGDGVVEWDDEDGEFGAGEGGEGGEGQEQGQEMQGDEMEEEQQGEEEHELHEAPLLESIDDAVGPVDENGPVDEDDPVQTVAQQSDVSDAQSDVSAAQPDVQQDDQQASESAPPADQGSWFGSMDGL